MFKRKEVIHINYVNNMLTPIGAPKVILQIYKVYPYTKYIVVDLI